MDMQVLNKALDFTRKRKKWVMLLAALGVSGYGVYKVYNLPSIAKKRKKLIKLLSTLVSIAEMVSDSAETVGVISKDLRQFLESDSDEIPNSLRQISRIVQSTEFSESVFRVTEALTRGVVKGYQGSKGNDGVGDGSDLGYGLFYDRVLDKVFSSSGSGFASVVVGSFARNLVLGFNSTSNGGSSDGAVPSWVNVMCDERCRDLIGHCIQTFVSTVVAVYLDKTMDVNTYDELFAGLTNPKHEKQMRDMLVFVCKGSIETLVKTSHQVLSSSDSGQKSDAESSDNVSRFVVKRSNSDVVSKPLYSTINDARNVITVKNNGYGRGVLLGLGGESSKSSEQSGKSGWISTMSSTLAVPNNRKFVLDVTGRVTFETVRSFLDFLLEKAIVSAKRSAHVVNEVIVERGLQIVRYVSYKTSLIAAICISLCLHVLNDTRYLVHA